MRIDLGDAVLNIDLKIRDQNPLPRFVWQLGPIGDTTPAERTPGPAPTWKPPPGKVDWIMDIKADQKTTCALKPKDEAGNPTTFDGTITYEVDDPSLVTLVADTDNNTAELTATGALGPAIVTATATRTSDGKVSTGTGLLNVIAGDAEVFEMEFTTPEEATPDA